MNFTPVSIFSFCVSSAHFFWDQVLGQIWEGFWRFRSNPGPSVPQNARNSISKDLSFKNFMGDDAHAPPYKGDCLWQSVTRIPFSKLLHAP